MLDRNKWSVLDYVVKNKYPEPPISRRAIIFEEIVKQGIPSREMQKRCQSATALLENSSFDKNQRDRILQALDSERSLDRQ